MAINIKLTSTDGMTLATRGKICSDNISVMPEIQDKTVTTSPCDVTADYGYCGLGTVRVRVEGIEANKAVSVTENGEVEITPTSPNASMAKVTLTTNVPDPVLTGDATASDVTLGKKFYADSLTQVTGTMPIYEATTVTSNQTLATNGKRISGNIVVDVPLPTYDGTATAEDVSTGKTFFNTTANKITGTMQSYTASTITSNQTLSTNNKRVVGDIVVDVPAPTLTGNASTGDVLTGKTFYKDSTSKLTGTMGTYTASTVSGNTILQTDGKKVVGNIVVDVPTPTLSGNASASDVLTGKTFYSNDVGIKVTGTLPDNGTVTQTISSQNGTYTIPAGKHSGSGVITDTLPSYSGNTSITANGTVSVGGKYCENNITVNVPSPTLTGSATAPNVLSGKTFYNTSTSAVTGSMANNGAVTSTLSAQGATYSIPSGYHNGSGVVTASLPAYSGSTSITANGTIAVSGKYCPNNITVNVPSPTLTGNATTDKVLAGATFYKDSTTKLTGTIPTYAGAVVQEGYTVSFTVSNNDSASVNSYAINGGTDYVGITNDLNGTSISNVASIKFDFSIEDMNRVLTLNGTSVTEGTEYELTQNSTVNSNGGGIG